MWSFTNRLSDDGKFVLKDTNIYEFFFYILIAHKNYEHINGEKSILMIINKRYSLP